MVETTKVSANIAYGIASKFNESRRTYRNKYLSTEIQPTKQQNTYLHPLCRALFEKQIARVILTAFVSLDI